jgi:hypothetical protein
VLSKRMEKTSYVANLGGIDILHTYTQIYNCNTYLEQMSSGKNASKKGKSHPMTGLQGPRGGVDV